MNQASSNIARHLPAAAARFPFRRAVVVPGGRDRQGRRCYAHLTFRQLDDLSSEYAWGLTRAGVTPGMKALLMVRPGLDFIALTYALFKAGACPVLIDPGMGWRGFLRCVRQVGPEVFLGIPLAHVVRTVFRGSFRSVRVPVTLGRRPLLWNGLGQQDLRGCRDPFPIVHRGADDQAAVLFTTGSTGPAKGVLYTHAIFDAQLRIIRAQYGISDTDIDLQCFPLFSLFTVALGMTAVIPDMDPTRPAAVDPALIVEAVHDQGATFSFGSPTLWRRVAAHCRERDLTLPTLTRVLMAGAPIPGRLHRTMIEDLLPAGGDVHTPYGATESLPIASFEGRRVLAETDALSRAGAGTCVGRPLPEMTIRVIRILDEAVETWDESLVLPQGEIGEIAVKGPVVTPAYYGLPEQTRQAKIHDRDGIWHRMGDVGYLDEQGRVWFCGRMSHRVRTADGDLFTVRCEAIFNEHPRVYRSALVGVGAPGAQTPVIVIEPDAASAPRSAAGRAALARELLELAQGSELTERIRYLLFHRSFPVDIRHNAKIKRELLAVWAAKRMARAYRLP
jgi:acyl-CoA synthetase (AMP-forming)/AMP-acid ligase II